MTVPRFAFLAALAALLTGCREDPAALVASDARATFSCEGVDVRFAGTYDGPSPNTAFELYEVSTECGDQATYRCEIFDDGVTFESTCCRFGEPACGE
jgi:hypothetical protein